MRKDNLASEVISSKTEPFARVKMQMAMKRLVH